MEHALVTLDSAAAYNALYGLPTCHPLVAVEMQEGEFAPVIIGIYSGDGCYIPVGRL